MILFWITESIQFSMACSWNDYTWLNDREVVARNCSAVFWPNRFICKWLFCCRESLLQFKYSRFSRDRKRASCLIFSRENTQNVLLKCVATTLSSLKGTRLERHNSNSLQNQTWGLKQCSLISLTMMHFQISIRSESISRL